MPWPTTEMPKQSKPQPDQPSDELTDTWEQALEELDARLRASGTTVTVMESSDSAEYTVTFPASRRRAEVEADNDDQDEDDTEEEDEVDEDALLAPLLALADAGPVTIGIEWAYEMHTVDIPPDKWRDLVRGDGIDVCTTDAYEGQDIEYTWDFNGLDSLDISYDDGGCAYIGSAWSATVYLADGSSVRLGTLKPKATAR